MQVIKISNSQLWRCCGWRGYQWQRIFILGIIIWAHKGFALDMSQLTLEGVTPGNIATGLVLVMFGFSGFESATSLGDEAKNP
jgi:hypothetical protein